MNEVVTYESPYDKTKLLAMSGALVGGNQTLMPNLYINRAPLDRDTEEPLPVGVLVLQHKDHGQVFSKPKQALKFRPYSKQYRYEVYDSEKDATVARSVFFTDFSGEVVADNGKFKAGHVKRDAAPILPSTQKAKCKIYVFGTVSFEGETAKKTPVKVENYPCFIKLAGKDFLEYDDVFKKLAKKNKLMFLYDLNVSPKFDGKFFRTEISWDNLTEEATMTKEIIETLETFAEHIENENKRIRKKWDQIVKNQATAEEIADQTVADVEDTLAEDLKDDAE